MLPDVDHDVAQSLSVEDWLQQAYDNGLNGWTGPIPIGREDRGRFKLPWAKGLHGIHGADAAPDLWEDLAADANLRREGTPGILALAERLPEGVLGIDVDAYDGKNGEQTLADWEAQFGPLPPTYRVTARGDGVSGIRLYRVPVGFYPKETHNSGVEFLDHHHRYMAAPPSWHHIGKPYRLILPNGKRSKFGILPSVDTIPLLPQSYLDGLPARATMAGGAEATDPEVAEFGQVYDSGPQPEAVLWIIGKTVESPESESTRNATRDALCWAAREAKGRRFGWDNAVELIRSAAENAYQDRGKQIDEHEFCRLVAYAVGQVRDTDEDDLYEAWQSDDWTAAVSSEGGGDPTQPSESDVQKEVRRQNTVEEARRRRQAAGWNAPPEQGSLADQLQNVDTAMVYVVEDVFPDGAICQVNAQFKIGKTTLVTNLVQSLATGDPFLRRFRVKSVGNIAHWNMEVSQNTLLGWYRKQGMPDEALGKCFPLSVRGNLSLDFNNDSVVAWTLKWLKDNDIQAWIIDPLSKLYRDDENSSTEFNKWWLRLEHIAREAGLKLVVVVHHTGHANERSRGTSAMMGNPDVLLSYTHAGNLGEKAPSNLRYLSAIGRDVDLPSTEINWEADTNTLFCTNSGTTRVQAKSDVKARQVAVAVWESDAPLKVGDLYAALGWHSGGTESKENARAVKRAVDKDYIVQTPNGRTVWNSRGTVDPRSLGGGGT
ncbi:MAG: AAA family ATPase [Mycobacterium sp.]|nr:AAA family ATPase [Mycobacterium sp.]